MFILWKNCKGMFQTRFDNKDLIDFIEKLNEIYYSDDVNSNDIEVIINGEEIPKRTWMKFYIY